MPGPNENINPGPMPYALNNNVVHAVQNTGEGEMEIVTDGGAVICGPTQWVVTCDAFAAVVNDDRFRANYTAI